MQWSTKGEIRYHIAQWYAGAKSLNKNAHEKDSCSKSNLNQNSPLDFPLLLLSVIEPWWRVFLEFIVDLELWSSSKPCSWWSWFKLLLGCELSGFPILTLSILLLLFFSCPPPPSWFLGISDHCSYRYSALLVSSTAIGVVIRSRNIYLRFFWHSTWIFWHHHIPLSTCQSLHVVPTPSGSMVPIVLLHLIPSSIPRVHSRRLPLSSAFSHSSHLDLPVAARSLNLGWSVSVYTFCLHSSFRLWLSFSGGALLASAISLSHISLCRELRRRLRVWAVLSAGTPTWPLRRPSCIGFVPVCALVPLLLNPCQMYSTMKLSSVSKQTSRLPRKLPPPMRNRRERG